MRLVSRSGRPPVLLDRQRTRIGRSPDNDVVLPGETISSYHAEVIVQGDAVFLRDLDSTNGTFVNGQRVRALIPLVAGSVIGFGRDQWIFETTVSSPVGGGSYGGRAYAGALDEPPDGGVASHSRGGARDADGPLLRLFSGGHYPSVVRLGAMTRVGRSPDNDLVLARDSISGHHAHLMLHEGDALLVDEDSTNGTWVNGERVSTRRLRHGDQVSFDEIIYIFEGGGQARGSLTRVNPRLQVGPRAGNSDGSDDDHRKSPLAAHSEPAVQNVLEQSNEIAGSPSVSPKKGTSNWDADKPSREEKPKKERPIIIKESDGCGGCAGCLMVLIFVFVVLPILATVFKIGALMYFFDSILGAIPFL